MSTDSQNMRKDHQVCKNKGDRFAEGVIFHIQDQENHLQVTPVLNQPPCQQEQNTLPVLTNGSRPGLLGGGL